MDFAAASSLLHCVFPGFTDRTLQVLSLAHKRALAAHQALVTPENVLSALATIQPGVGRVALENLGIDFQAEASLITALAPLASPTPPADYQAFSSETNRLLTAASAAAKELGHNYVGTEHLVIGLLRCGPCPAGDYLRARGITVETFCEKALKLLAG